MWFLTSPTVFFCYFRYKLKRHYLCLLHAYLIDVAESTGAVGLQVIEVLDVAPDSLCRMWDAIVAAVDAPGVQAAALHFLSITMNRLPSGMNVILEL